MIDYSFSLFEQRIFRMARDIKTVFDSPYNVYNELLCNLVEKYPELIKSKELAIMKKEEVENGSS